MSTWNEERRANQAAAAAEARRDADAAAERRIRARALDAETRREAEAAERAQQRTEQQQARRDRQARRRDRAARRAELLAPASLYRRGTVALVTASALASLPAQLLHFVGISLMLAPVPLAIEGAAWVMAAGVAHADDRGLPGWVRWALRGGVLAAAGFAASINYGYGRHLEHLTTAQQQTAGLGLAAVSLLGPLLFEVRQWVGTLSAAAVDPKEKAAAKERQEHAAQRARHHRPVVDLAGRLISAAPHGALDPETAFAAAWEISYGTRAPGMTPELHVQAARSHGALAQALAETGMSAEAAEVELLLADLFGPGRNGGDATAGSRGGWKRPQGPAGGANAQVKSQMPIAPKKGAEKGEDGRRGNGGMPPRRRAGDTPKYSRGARRAASEAARRQQQDDQQ